MGEGARSTRARSRAAAGRKGTTVRDTELMARALTLAEGARRRTPPNPWVGCVLVADGVVVGEGATHPPGGAHAEAAAVAAAGDGAAGATAYVTLEPCAHQGRTGPCVDALVRAGVARRRRRRGPRPAGRRPGLRRAARRGRHRRRRARRRRGAPLPRPLPAPASHRSRVLASRRRPAASTGAPPRGTARRGGSPARRPTPTPMGCAPTRRPSWSAPARPSPTSRP